MSKNYQRMKKFKNVLIIIQRSNGDVFFASTLVNKLKKAYDCNIDLLVNDDTLSIAKLFQHVRRIHTFSYHMKKTSKWSQEKSIIKSIFRKYDLSINLTSSDRSVLYAILASRNSISAVETQKKKSWWKKLLLWKYYFFDTNSHILLNNLSSLNLLNIEHPKVHIPIEISQLSIDSVKKKLYDLGVEDFIIFHPSAQYSYKIYPKENRDKLLSLLSSLNCKFIVTGSNNSIDTAISQEIKSDKNIINLIGKTTIEEFVALSYYSRAYIGMDTLNMHIASSQNKKIFAIFGPTNLRMWSPWSNLSGKCTQINTPMQTYDKITIFQADLPCVACGMAGCDDNHGKSECLYHIDPKKIFSEVKKFVDTF